jgi:hypothetical protein
MTTATRPRPAAAKLPPPEHGEDDRCYRHGCRREECRASYRTTRKRGDLRRARGIPGHTTGERVATHLQKLIDSGWTRLQIAETSGVSYRTIRYILGGQREVQIRNAAKLLAVQPLPEVPRVDPTGTRRRIQALACMGWPVTYTARQAGCSHQHIFGILRGDVTAVLRGTADAFAEVYRTHSRKPGHSAFTRTIAASNGWHGPLAWDNIDDPTAQPEAGDVPEPELKRDQRAELRRDEINHLAGFGVTPEEIKQRLADDDLSLSHIRSIVAEFRTGKKKDRTKQAASA